MTRTCFILAIGAAAALAGCNKQDHTIVVGPNASDDSAANSTTPVALPPSVTASKIYRCADNTIVYVDWLSDGKSANVRTEQGGMPTQVTTAEPGKPMTAAGGFEVAGSASAPSAKIAVPGHSAQSCKA
jgi:hypothetical protein